MKTDVQGQEVKPAGSPVYAPQGNTHGTKEF